MGDRYYSKHQKKKPKRTDQEIKDDRMKRNKDKKNKRGY